MEFTLLKAVHVAAVTISYALFFLRGVCMIADSPLLTQRWLRIAPHVNDTVLLVAGIWTAILIRQYPGTHAWLSAKLVALVIYILLGMLALKPGRGRTHRIAAWCAAQGVFAYIVAVALTRDPLLGLVAH
jgi:uncharacterized membrane protein SirB2